MKFYNTLTMPFYNADLGGGGGGATPPAAPEISAEHVTAFISTNPDYLNNILSTDIGKKAVQPLVDSHFSKGLETWKANNLDKIVNERVESLFPNETPQSKQMREMQAQIDKINGEKRQVEMQNFTTNVLVSEGIPTQFAKFFNGQDEASIRGMVSEFKHEFTSALNGTVDSKFKEMGHQPLSQPATGGTTQAKSLAKMSYAERMALFNSNPTEYNRLSGR